MKYTALLDYVSSVDAVNYHIGLGFDKHTAKNELNVNYEYFQREYIFQH